MSIKYYEKLRQEKLWRKRNRPRPFDLSIPECDDGSLYYRIIKRCTDRITEQLFVENWGFNPCKIKFQLEQR